MLFPNRVFDPSVPQSVNDSDLDDLSDMDREVVQIMMHNLASTRICLAHTVTEAHLRADNLSTRTGGPSHRANGGAASSSSASSAAADHLHSHSHLAHSHLAHAFSAGVDTPGSSSGPSSAAARAPVMSPMSELTSVAYSSLASAATKV